METRIKAVSETVDGVTTTSYTPQYRTNWFTYAGLFPRWENIEDWHLGLDYRFTKGSLDHAKAVIDYTLECQRQRKERETSRKEEYIGYP